MLKQYVSEYDFRDWFLGSDTYKHNFSYDGLTALYAHLEQLSEDIGYDIDFDPVAIVCEYAEDHWSDIADNYSIPLTPPAIDGDPATLWDDAIADVIEYLEDNTLLVAVLDNGNIVYVGF